MAKIKVHELAKEIDVTSKDIIACLADLGIEGKTASSGLEEEEAAGVKKKLGKAGTPEESKKAEETKKVENTEAAAPVKGEAAEAKGEAAEAVKTQEAAMAPKKKIEIAGQAAPGKKKKSTIIVVSGKQNRNQQGQGRPDNSRGSLGNGQRSGAPVRPSSGIIRPTVPTTAARQARYLENNPQEGNRDAQQLRRESLQQAQKNDKAVKESINGNAVDNGNGADNNKGTAAAQAQVSARPVNDRPKSDEAQNDIRHPQGDRSQGDRRPQGDRSQGDRRPQGDRSQGDRRPQGDRSQNDRRSQGDRPQRGGDGKPFNKNGVIINQSKNYASDKSSAKDDLKRGADRNDRRRNDKKKDERFGNEDGFRGGKPVKGAKVAKLERPSDKKKEEAAEEKIKVITIPEVITIKDLADKMKIPSAQIIKKLFLGGKVVTVNEEISYEEAEEIAVEYEILCEKEVVVDVIEELLREEEDDPATLTSRPPVICVMGHVDHGKTSLLDAIRNTKVIEGEAGGITQAIGAYVVEIGGRKITFLDTPGHEAFTAMRMRGANATDIAILVVAADDGVMPQTVEAINHAKAAGIEIIVAVNKIDKPSANIDRVKQELSEYDLIPEDWGGSTVFAPVSAKSGEGIAQLLEMILLTSDILELKANAKRKARGLVIEAELDKGRGPVATVLVQKGTLKVGDFIAAGACHGKVRAMIDDNGRRVKEAGPSTPVEILGLNDVPGAGEIFMALSSDKEAKNFADTFIAQNKAKLLADTKAKMSLDQLFSQIEAGNLKELNLILKADVQGSVEAVKESLLKLSNEEVVVKVIHSGVGAINESDVILASASNAIIIGFNVRPDAAAKDTAETEGVDVRLYDVIYKAIEDVEAAMKGMLDPIFEEKIIGHVEIRQIFKASGIGNIAGSYVLDGMIQRNCLVRITRQGELVHEGKLASLKRFKDDAKEVKSGFECGLVFEDWGGFEELDIVEAYIMVEVPRT